MITCAIYRVFGVVEHHHCYCAAAYLIGFGLS